MSSPGLASDPTTATSRGLGPRRALTEMLGHLPPTMRHPSPLFTIRKRSSFIMTVATACFLKTPTEATPERGVFAGVGSI